MKMIDLITLNSKNYNIYLNSKLYDEMSIASEKFTKNKKSLIYNKLWVKDAFLHFSRKAEYQYVFDQIENEKKILDAGCGITFFPFFLKTKFSDIELDLVDYTKSTKKFFNKTNFNYINSDLNNLKISDSLYDIVYCISTLEHIKSYKTALKELHRILKPNGKLILTFDVSFSDEDNINFKNVDDFINSIISTFEISNFNYELNLENMITSHDFKKEDLPWIYPKIFYKFFYFFKGKKNISIWPPKIGIVMMSITKNKF